MVNSDTVMAWIAEADFIEHVVRGDDPVAFRQSFNSDTECLARYCRMQADHMVRDGFAQLAAGVRALPIYRRQAGGGTRPHEVY